MRYGNEQFFEVLGRELPHRIHEYRWWNLVDIAELYMKLKWPAEKDPDMILRFGNEVWKYHRVMNGKRLSRKVHEVGPHDLAQAVYSLMMVGSRQEYFFEQIVLCIMDDPLRFHLQQLAAFARAFKTLNFVPSVDILSLFADKTQLRGCSIDALATVAALGLGDLQNAALDILTSGVDDNIYTNPEGWYDDDASSAAAAIKECSCDDIMLILRGVRNNEEQVHRVRVALERYWLPLHYDTITAEEFSWLIWDMASITSSNNTGGKYTWGKPTDPPADAALDKGDPNYDSEEEQQQQSTKQQETASSK
ncbi:hypothetical protein FOZ61_010961 [Perkinsus olseni]|uniref:Uncharacterized protein n=2 Tax=Perkinsus olseni TaxID=32597 RepID=A0A7J6KUW6_PEROL|nr:hypothetical protein FOZ61_010961 [Perkinsus olseni]